MVKRNYKPRVAVVFLLFMMMYSIIFIRLFLIQIYQKDFFTLLAKHQYHVDVTMTPPRATIIDRNGTLLAINRQAQSAFILPRQLSNKKQAMQFLKRYYKPLHKKVAESKAHFLWVERGLSQDRYNLLTKRIEKHNIKDIRFMAEKQRHYPFESLTSVLGKTNIDNQGIAGIEADYDAMLAGTPSVISLQRDARSRDLYFEKIEKISGEEGNTVQLTIDTRLQYLADQELKKTMEQFKAQQGAVLVMNPDNGQILAMANHSIDKKSDPARNTIVADCYELGSVFKMFSALAALDEGVVELDEEIDCEGKVGFVNGVRVENWKSVDILPFYEVVSKSSNIGMAKIMQRLGNKLYDHFVRLGFGRMTGSTLLGERGGFVNPPHKWSKSSLIVQSFGYEVMATLLQLGQATCMIANGGYTIRPHMILSPVNIPYSYEKGDKIYSEITMSSMKDILEHIGKHYPVEGFRTMGKTGTARMVIDGQYSKKKHMYTFAGIIEKGNYRRVIITFVKEPERHHLWASQVSAPLFQRVAEKIALCELVN